MNSEAKQRAARMLLDDLENGKREWYLITFALKEGGPAGGVFIRAFGPTDAWRIMHGINVYRNEVDGTTCTHGPIAEEAMTKVPENFRWRRLAYEELQSI